jgi:hypothetical protein
LAFAALVLVVLTGCRAGGGRGLPPGAIRLRALPAQGLVEESRAGVTLRDLRGKRLAWLPRFAVYPGGSAAQASAAYYYQGGRLRLPLVYGPKGWYRLDPARHALIPVRGGRLPLGNDAAVIARRDRRFVVLRGGRVLLRGGLETLRIVSSRLVQSGTTLLDVGTNRRRQLPKGCLPAGLVKDTVILACGVAHGADAATRLVLERMAPGRPPRLLTPKLAELYPDAASLSPDGAWVAVEGRTGCAASYVYVAPIQGGAARLVYGRTPTNPFASYYSTLLGWDADGRLVVLIEPQHCDTPYGPQHPPRGVYLVDPRTLRRTLVTRSAVAMWNSAARLP